MCAPTFFDIEYEINPWMKLEHKVKKAQAKAAHTELKKLYKSLSVACYDIEANKRLPDMVFTANAGFVFNDVFIRSNFKYAQRRKEADLAERFFEKQFHFRTVTLPDSIYFEGQGDLLTDGERFFFGWSKRSDYRAKPYLEDVLNHPLIHLQLVDPYYYHLDTCFAPLDRDTVVINARSFTPEGLKVIRDSFKTVIETSEEDNKVMCCNLVHIGKQIIVGKGISKDYKQKLAKLGYKVNEIDMAEFLKSGGSVKCCTFEF